MQSHSDDAVPKVKEETDFTDTSSQSHLDDTFQKSVDVLEVDDEVQIIDDEGDQSSENASNQLVVYNPTSDTDQTEPFPEPIGYQPPPFPSDSTPHPPSRVLPSVGAFTVQCAICFKWRLIPTKEKYEEIRENILQQPFACETAREWRPDISCDDPADLSQDNSRLWAIDKPNIAQPPPGWQRLLRIRGEGSTRFADMYLLDHPEYATEGVTMARFSFQIPKPLQENYVRKRPARVPSSYDSPGQGISSPLEPREVNPLNWASPADGELLIGRGGLLNSCLDAPVLEPVTPPEKKRAKKPSNDMYSSTVYNQPQIKSESSNLFRNG
ncbi:methyl-CpG-binding domain-containing protein 2-like isoform X2 [Telopea speciosissima]|uniref:methyl-CpG-binding domain-containing protein 2-like isoform X2 n=1 Tax=Telopea speciosissima TaxID=54955 RepID=UPI001CC3D583|nr:methyl-CpG-binding domain-containing protein 2-like isoform X2 [Telopea speciosissima]